MTRIDPSEPDWIQPTSDALTRTCSHCDHERPRERAGEPTTYACPHCRSISVWFCHVCGTRAPGTWTQKGEDEIRRCGSCHVEYLKRRAEADPISPEDLAACQAKIAAALAKAAAKWGLPKHARAMSEDDALWDRLRRSGPTRKAP